MRLDLKYIIIYKSKVISSFQFLRKSHMKYMYMYMYMRTYVVGKTPLACSSLNAPLWDSFHKEFSLGKRFDFVRFTHHSLGKLAC